MYVSNYVYRKLWNVRLSPNIILPPPPIYMSVILKYRNLSQVYQQCPQKLRLGTNLNDMMDFAEMNLMKFRTKSTKGNLLEILFAVK